MYEFPGKFSAIPVSSEYIMQHPLIILHTLIIGCHLRWMVVRDVHGTKFSLKLRPDKL